MTKSNGKLPLAITTMATMITTTTKSLNEKYNTTYNDDCNGYHDDENNDD